MVPLSTLVHQTTVPVQPLAINHQSQFPAVTISFNLKGDASLGDAVTQVQQHARRHGRASHRAGQLPGHRAGVPVVAEHRAVS